MKTLNFNQEQVTQILQDVIKGKDGYNQLFKMALEAMMREEREVHNKEQGDQSNGYRPRKFFGRGKVLELQVPRSRHHQFYPVLLSIAKDQQEECRRLAFQLYGAGLTTEQVGDIFEELYGRHYSKSQVSRMFDGARHTVNEWLQRPLQPYYPIIYIDATFLPIRRAGSVSREAFYTVLGVRPDRTREVLAVVNIPTESAEGWRDVFQQLRERGLERVDLVVSDGVSGLEKALPALDKDADHQLCLTHLQRQLQHKVRRQDKQALSEEFNVIFRTRDMSYTAQEAWQAWKEFTERWGSKYPSIRKMGKDPWYRRYMTYLNYDYRIQSMIYTTNWIERLNRDYKRVTRMRGALPDSQSALLLLGRVAMSRKAYARKVPHLQKENEKFDWNDQ